MTEPTPAQPRFPAARLALWIAAAWVAAGALFKLFAGSPNDLPPLIQEFPLLRPAWTFRLAIGVELSAVILALARPRIGWACLALLFAFFDLVLLQMMRAGEQSCGCFGSSVPIQPWQMMAIDTVLLAGLLITRTWRAFPKRALRPLLLLPLFALVIGAPWFMFEEARVPPQGGSSEDPGGDWYLFQPASWEGEMIHDTDLARFFDPPGSVDLIPPPAHVIVYRLSCEHCEQHFIELMANPITDRQLVLVRVPEPGNPSDVVSAVKPPALLDVDLRELPRGYGITTPVTFDVDENFIVTNVLELGE